MLKQRPIYVVDTNILVDYVDIIPPPVGQKIELREPTIDLSGAHIVIPSAVIRELSSFKGEKSERGKAARVALRRLRELSEGQIRPMGELYQLEAPIEVAVADQCVSILPVHKNFKKALPFAPSEDDMDGQIILATLSIAFGLQGIAIDGTAEVEAVRRFSANDLPSGGEVVLLTNDNGLAIRARERGLKTSRYGYKYPEPYTGRRDIVVPSELFKEFFCGRRVEREVFENLMPLEEKLVANEFIVMSPIGGYPREYDADNDPYFQYIGRYDCYEDAIIPLRYASNFPGRIETPGQAIYAEALMDPEVAAVVCTGPAGSGKTYMATVYGYNACKSGDFIGVTAVPCASQSNHGALPGDLEEKMDPELQPLKNALRNYLLNEDAKLHRELENLRKFGVGKATKCEPADADEESPGKRSLKEKLNDRVELIWRNWFTSVPIESARGRDFAYELAIYDEFQDQTISQADTLIKRLGREGKIILTGDIHQIHAPYLDENSNGLVYAARMLYDNPMVAQVCFTEDEVVRHPLVRMIAQRQRETGKDVVVDIVAE